MTFHFPEGDNNVNQNAPANGQRRTNPNTGKEVRTRGAYINLYLPLEDGERVKLVSDLTLGLYLEKEAEKQIIDLIKSGVITAEQAGSLVQVEINLVRDESKPIKVDISRFAQQATNHSE